MQGRKDLVILRRRTCCKVFVIKSCTAQHSKPMYTIKEHVCIYAWSCVLAQIQRRTFRKHLILNKHCMFTINDRLKPAMYFFVGSCDSEGSDDTKPFFNKKSLIVLLWHGSMRLSIKFQWFIVPYFDLDSLSWLSGIFT